MMEETRMTDTEGVVTNVFLEDGPAGTVEARGAGDLTTADRDVSSAASNDTTTTQAASGGQSFVANAGGDPKTVRILDYTDDGALSAVRMGRMTVRQDGTLAIEELTPQSAETINAREIEVLENRIERLRGGGEEGR